MKKNVPKKSRIAVSLTNNNDLTRGKKYLIYDEKIHHGDIHYLLINNSKEKKYVIRNPYGIIQVDKLSNIYVRYIGKNYTGLTNNKLYQIFDRADSTHFYFMNDYSRYVGIIKRNFIDVKKHRLKILNELLKDEKT